MIIVTMFFFGVKMIWDKKNARMNLENFQNIDNHLRETKLTAVKT